MQTFVFHATPHPLIDAVFVMVQLKISIQRDVGKNPSIVYIERAGRRVKAVYDGDNLTIDGQLRDLPTIAEALRIAYPYEIESNSRPDWFDRKPLSIVDQYSSNAAPHAETARVTYTCPQDRKAMVELLYGEVSRMVADPGVFAWCGSRWKFTPAGKTEAELFTVQFYDNNVGKTTSLGLGTTLTLLPGDKIIGYTIDLSAGGTINYQLNYKLTEFDL